MLLGVIADDFTGASDIANVLARGQSGQGGLRTVQFIGVPADVAPAGIEAGVVALKSRSIPAALAVEQSLAALGWLLAQGCTQIVFKYCSTFDSTPCGNIGPVAEALAEALGVAGVVACPAFPTLQRSVYQGHLFVGDRLLNESGMQNHPLNPMADADLRRWLARQTKAPVGLANLNLVAEGAERLARSLAEAGQRGETLVIVDAVSDQDLLTIAAAARDAPLLTGGSGIALGLPANFVAAGRAIGGVVTRRAIGGPEAILVGSCSRATREQVAVHGAQHPSLRLDVDALMRGEVSPEMLVDFVLAHTGSEPMVSSSGSPEEVAALHLSHGAAAVAERLDRLFADTARLLVARGVRRLVVAGGETSGAVISALGPAALEIGPEIDPGVPALYADGPPPLALVLKSGNFGGPDFLHRAVTSLAG